MEGGSAPVSPEPDTGESGRTSAFASYASLFNTVRKECKHHADFVRELVSNSYDAGAHRIDVFPHYVEAFGASCSVFAMYDNGKGMDHYARTEDENRGLDAPPFSSIDSYTQLGHSTNTGTNSIGRFCYGSKQAFNKADAGFMLATRTERIPPDKVLLIDENDIEHELLCKGGVNWKIVDREVAVNALAERFSRLKKPGEVVDTTRELSARIRTMGHGTIQVIFSRGSPFHHHKLCNLNTLQRHWKRPSKPSRILKEDVEFSTLYTVLRFKTRHGTALYDDAHQFQSLRTKVLAEFSENDMGAKLMHRAELRLYTKEHPTGFAVPYGQPRPEEKLHKNPSEIRGRSQADWTGCWARLGPVTFRDDSNRPFAVLWDQNSFYTLRTDFESLSRRGQHRTDCEGIGTFAAGFRVQCVGVRVCEFPASVIRSLPVEPHSPLRIRERDMFIAFLNAGEKGGAVCTIEGNFQVEPNRYALSQEELVGLKSNKRFMTGLAAALHQLLNTKNADGKMMEHLLTTLYKTNRDIQEQNIEDEAKTRAKIVDESARIMLRPLPGTATPAWILPLCMAHFVPCDERKHENFVQHMVSTFHTYALYAARNPPPSASAEHRRALELWRFLRPAMHYSTGVDVLTIRKDHELGEEDSVVVGMPVQCRTCNVEYKWRLLTEYNHPFIATNFIVAWDTDNVEPKMVIIDKQNCEGVVKTDDDLGDLGFVVANITDDGHLVYSRSDTSTLHSIRIINLRRLILATFAPYCSVEINEAIAPPSSKRSRRK